VREIRQLRNDLTRISRWDVASGGRVSGDDHSGSSNEAALKRLGMKLITPLGLPSTVKRVLICADEAFYALPWAAAIVNGKYWVESVEIAEVPSIAVLKILRSRGKPKSQGVLVLGALGTVTSADAGELGFGGGGLPALPGGRRECQAVAKAWRLRKPTQLVERGELWDVGGEVGTGRWLLKNMGRYNVVHIVCHGRFDALLPMQSCIVLAGSGSERKVRAADLARENLDDVDMVVLSACRTGNAVVEPGGEPRGFTRALLGAGVRSVVATHWDIDDAVTAELMARFHMEYASGKTKSRALREAQLQIMRQHKQPYYWAGVSLYGSPD